MTTRETSSRPAAMASSAVNLEDVLSEEFLTEPAIGPPSEELRAGAAAQENQKDQQQRQPIPTLPQETRDRLQKEREQSYQSLVAASTTSQHTTTSFGSTTVADAASLSASQHQQARYAAVAQMLGDDDILTTTGDFSSIGGGDATTSTATAAGALSISQRTTESEETVRARYQAAALVMEERFDQTQEDQIAKDRARLVRGSTSVSNNSGLSVSSFHDDLIEDKYSSVRLASSPQSAVSQSLPNETKVSFRSGLSSSSTHTQNALSSSSHHSSARRSRQPNTAAGLGSSSHHSSSRREDLAAKDRGRRIPSIQRGSNHDTVAGMNTIGTASTNNLDTTTTTSSSSSSAVTTTGLSQVTPGALAVADGRAQQLAKASISRAPLEPSREFTVPIRPMAPQSSSSTPYTVSSQTSTILPTSSNAQEQQRHPPFSFSHGDTEDAMEAVPSEAANSKMDASSSSRKRLYLWLGLGLLVVLVAGVVGAVVGVSGGDDIDDSPATTTQQSRPNDPPTMAPVVLVESQILQDIRAFLSEEGISTETQLLDSSSPQYQALAWVTDISSEEWGILSEEEEQDVLARYALAVFYYTLGGPNWVTEMSNQQPNGASWLENRGTNDGIQNVCDWQGISCSGGLVESIQFLSSKRLRGDLPTELNVMSSLRSLQIENNEIQGLKGPLTNLRVLSLSGNSLGELNIGIPSAIMEMTNLQSLDLSGNDLVGTLSGDIQNFASLNNLDLSDNRFEGTLSTQFRSMPSLRDLRFSINNFEGDINVIMENLPSELRALQGGQNNLSGSLTATMVMFSNLARFELPDNDMSGAFPNAVFDLSSLAILDLSLNSFTGSLAESIGNPGGALERLRLSGNQLSGSIPTSIGRLVGLYDLFLQRNALSGPIPTELAQCQSLESVLLNSNFLSGPIPSELGTLQNLKTLAVEVNELTGSLPSELGQLQKLRDLRVLANFFTGILPSEICALPSLNQVDATAASDIDCGGCSKCV